MPLSFLLLISKVYPGWQRFFQANKMSSAPLTFGVFAKQLKRCKRKLGLASNNIKQSIDIWENFSKCLKSMTSTHISSELYSVSPATGSVHANILFEVPTVHIRCFRNQHHNHNDPGKFKSLVALKRIETQGLGTPGESLVSLRVRFMSRCQFLIMSLAFNLETVNHKNYTVSFF